MLPADWLRRYKGKVETEHPLAPLTSWRIGGPAELFLEPSSASEAIETVRMLKRIGMPFRVLGGGSNLLISDRGVRGAVLSLGGLNKVSRQADRFLFAEGGAKLHWVVRCAAAEGLAGAECLAGIPGRVGGAVFGNAGGRHGDIGSLIRRIEVIDGQGRHSVIEPREGFFSYRASRIGDQIVLGVLIELKPTRTALVRAENRRVIRERRASQPGWVGNAGCVFRNPDGHSAGRLIDSADCKGMRVGGLFVSPQHANFMQNDGTGSEADVHRLVDQVRERVQRVHDVELEMEVRRWPE